MNINRHCGIGNNHFGLLGQFSKLFQVYHLISDRLVCPTSRSYLIDCDDGFFKSIGKTTLSVLVLFFLAFQVKAVIITVKQDGSGNYDNIQQAYENAGTGDTILVYPGIYFENVDIHFTQVDITIASLYLITQDEAYIYNTIVDGNQVGSCLAAHSCGNSVVTITGLSLRNGFGKDEYDNAGGGIYAYACFGGLFINNCIIENNTATVGGGVYLSKTTAYFSGSTIRYNHAYSTGGGVFCGWEANTIFDPVNKCNIYLNYSAKGADYSKTYVAGGPQTIILDTFTVLNPDYHFYYSWDTYNYPANDLNWSIDHGKLEPAAHDLFVNPVTGDDDNSGISALEPLKTIAYAYKKIKSDSVNKYSINLSNGIYSPSTNGEKLPLNARSFVSLIGKNKDSTVIDADSVSFFFCGYGLMQDYLLQNISFINGYRHGYACIYIEWNNKVKFNEITIRDNVFKHCPGFFVHRNKGAYFNNIEIINNKGGHPFRLGSYTDVPSYIRINNLRLINTKPSEDLDSGGGMTISCYSLLPNTLTGEITNLQITGNVRKPDPLWGPGLIVGLIVDEPLKLDLVNATIGDNILRGANGFAVSANDGAELNIYNSIFYGDSLKELSIGSIGSSDPSEVSVTHSNFEGGPWNISMWDNSDFYWLDGNIDADPMWDTASVFPYSLQWSSPCIDAGVPMYEPGMAYPYIKIEDEKIVLYKIDGDTLHIPSKDLAGNPRIVNGRIDMGAYEYQDTGTRVRKLFLQNLKEFEIEVYPNPFHANTFITFSLEDKASVEAYIYNLQGYQVKKLMDATLSPGNFTMTWEGDDDSGQKVSPGNYVVTIYLNGIKAGSAQIVKRKL